LRLTSQVIIAAKPEEKLRSLAVPTD
jgi:hypothetical protein